MPSPGSCPNDARRRECRPGQTLFPQKGKHFVSGRANTLSRVGQSLCPRASTHHGQGVHAPWTGRPRIVDRASTQPAPGVHHIQTEGGLHAIPLARSGSADVYPKQRFTAHFRAPGGAGSDARRGKLGLQHGAPSHDPHLPGQAGKMTGVLIVIEAHQVFLIELLRTQ